MSTKQSIYYDKGLHVYEELLSKDICLAMDYIYSENDQTTQIKMNEKDGTFTMSRDDWKRMAESLLEYLEKHG